MKPLEDAEERRDLKKQIARHNEQMELADVKMRANQDACDVIFNEEEKKKKN